MGSFVGIDGGLVKFAQVLLFDCPGMVTSELRGLAIRKPIGAAVAEPANTYVGGGAVDIGDDGDHGARWRFG